MCESQGMKFILMGAKKMLQLAQDLGNCCQETLQTILAPNKLFFHRIRTVDFVLHPWKLITQESLHGQCEQELKTLAKL